MTGLAVSAVAVGALLTTTAPAEARPSYRFVAQGDRIVMIASGLPAQRIDCEMKRIFRGLVDEALGSLATGYNHKQYWGHGRGPVVRVYSERLPRRTTYEVSGGCIDQRSNDLGGRAGRVYLR
ncbi:MAG: hypothetical protein QM728_01030 [Gordonia sp. (in: high G+C Gram-positive bacteria)]|uniref:hypothetical protein n=1 Tax=Gordonia sp. (in: high G+C Gram-positive bacteria) TaxID=84139 RepID=UPI0039E4DF48